MTKYRIVNYFDVWYNDEEGYQVNNLCEHAIVEIEDESAEGFLQACIDADFLKPDTTLEHVSFVFVGPEMTEIESKVEGYEGYPIGRLELVIE